MKLLPFIGLLIFVPIFAFASEVRYEISIDRVEPYFLGKPVWENTQMVVGDLKGKYLGKVLVGDVNGKLSLYLLACNETDVEVNVE